MRRGTTTSLHVTAAALLGSAALLAAGCSGHSVEYAEVQGKVTLGQAPLAGVIVTFYPDGESKESPPYSRGTTDASGMYKLAGLNGKSGAVVGKHRVVVNWPLRERSDDPAKAPPQPHGPPIPIKYTVASDTPLIFEVKAGGPQTIDLPLTR